MTVRIFSLIPTLLFTWALASCGGGSDPCGAQTQPFGIDFAVKTSTVKLGQVTKLSSTVTPESCRNSMTFMTRNGNIPPGMTLVNGDVAGTPTVVGTYSFQVYISAVSGYLPISEITAPRSGLITMTVAP